MTNMDRRKFIGTTAAAVWAISSPRAARAAAPSDTVVLAIVGANNRGSQLATRLNDQAGAAIKYVCDCDEKALQKGIATATASGRPQPKPLKDFRKALEDPEVDAIICAMPNHWHAAATILACSSGKHVYVEKPVSHTPDEGERMVAAARNNNRIVQVGLQRRSGPLYQSVVEKVREGTIGRVLYARSWYLVARPTVGCGKIATPPASLDYDLWQGPATAVPYRDNLIHYNWHFFWHWGNGELGNNGVHTIDICRWAMDIDYPSRVTASGAKLRFEDDQQTPDTCTVAFDCDGRSIVWEGISWARSYQSKSSIGIELRGENGAIYVDDGGYTIYDAKSKIVDAQKLSRGDDEHLTNFLDAIRTGSSVNADIEEGHKSTMFCHLGNIAFRTGRILNIDPTNGHIQNDTPDAAALWKREYRSGWMPDA